MLGHPVIHCCQVHKVLCAMATCYVSAVRSLSSQPAPSNEELVDMVVGADEEDVLAVGAKRVTGQGGGGLGWHGAGQGGQVVVVPARACDVELVDVVVGADEEDVLTVVDEQPVAGQMAGGGGWHGAGQGGQVVVVPARAGDEELVDVVVGADEEHVLTVVAEPMTGQSTGRGGWHGAGQGGQVVVGPAPAVDEELVDVIVGPDEEDVLAVVAEQVTGQGAGGRRWFGAPARVVRSLSAQRPSPAMKSSWTWLSMAMKKTCLLSSPNRWPARALVGVGGLARASEVRSLKTQPVPAVK